MTSSQRGNFGPLVRRERKAREIGLRDMAKMIGVSHPGSAAFIRRCE